MRTLIALAGTDAAAGLQPGPRVFLDYTQAELDAAYDQTAYMPHIQQLRDRWHSNSARTRARIGPPLRRAYGPSAIEQLDIFRTGAPAAAPVFVFIHGGAWRSGSASQYSAPGRDVRARRGALRRAGFHDGAGCRRQPVPDGRAGLPRDRLGLPQRG